MVAFVAADRLPRGHGVLGGLELCRPLRPAGCDRRRAAAERLPQPAPRRQPDIVRSWHPVARSAPALRPRDGAASFER